MIFNVIHNMRNFTLFIFLLLFVHQILPAQTGTLRGKIIDAKTGEELIGATVVVTGTVKGTISDFDGNFSLPLEPGTHNITISYISYETLNFPGVEIKDGEVTLLNVNLGEASVALEEVKVVARSRQRTEAALQILQKKSAMVLDGISAQQITRLGDGDAAGALKRVTGVSVEGGKYVYVRGLSDRYMNITLNSARIPGLDPNRNTVQMDLFPANIIENIVVSKTYSPDLPSFTGGNVDLVTKDFPEKFMLDVSASYSYNPQANGNDRFLVSDESNSDWLGFDNGLRNIPSEIQGSYIPAAINSTTIDTIYTISGAFSKIYSPVQKTSFIGQKYSISMGNQYNILGTQLGIIGAVSYQNAYEFYENGKIGVYDAISKDQMQSFEQLDETLGKHEVIWSALLSSTLKISNNHKLGITMLRNQNGLSGARDKVGYQSYDNVNVAIPGLEYLERSLSAVQIRGKHVFPVLNQTIIEWQSSNSYSELKEPDLRSFIEHFTVDTTVTPYVYSYDQPANRKPRRRYRDMYERNRDNNINVTVPFNLLGEKSKFMFGGAYLYKYRNSDEEEYVLTTRGTILNWDGIPESYVSDENLINAGNLYNGVYYNNDKLSNQTYSYTGKVDNYAGYVMTDLLLGPKFRMVFGVRYEYNISEIKNKVDTVEFNRATQKSKFARGSRENKNWLPAVNITYSLIENMNLRVAFSRTISQPFFREQAPYAFYDYDWGARVNGNPLLNISNSDNYDFRWEYFYAPGEMVSFSGFYKLIRNPIERFMVQKEVNRIEYRNHTDAEVYGLEFEFRKSLDFIPVLKNFQLGSNISLIKSVTDVDSTRYILAVSIDPEFQKTRPMFGQSPYLVNAFLSYNNTSLGLNANLAFNIAGEKIVLISKFATPDVYERPYPRLDFNISKILYDRFRVKFSLENILDPDFRQTYNLNGKDYIFRSHSSGREFKIGISYFIN